MPTAILQRDVEKRDGRKVTTSTTATITHNNQRLYNAGGRTYYYTGNDGSGNRIYKDADKN